MATLSVRAHIVLAAAISAVPMAALATAANDPGYTPVAGQEFFVSTSGATALGAFTRANTGSPTSTPDPDVALTRSTFSLGSDQLRIGNTFYTRTAVTGQFLAISNYIVQGGGTPDTDEPALTNDRLVYQYLERGSVNGLNDLINSNGLRVGSPATLPPTPTASQPMWKNGTFIGPGTFENRGVPITAQGPVRIAWSDVRFQQGFSVVGAANATRKTNQTGYGLGKGNVGGTNFQKLTPSEQIVGGVADSTTYVRNETLAVVPFNLVANPGSGLTRVTREEGGWLQAAGRLQNGANFNSSTRDAGSGTRNQGALNLGVDPSWAAGERDRLSLDSTSYNFTDPAGVSVTVAQGSEAPPTRSLLAGSAGTGVHINERRTGPMIRFADRGGGSILRETVFSSRMGVGILSGGDSRSNSNGNAGTTSTVAPVRALAIDFGHGVGTQDFRQATAKNVTDGKYDLWSATQAITISGTIDPDGAGAGVGTLVTTATNTAGTIYNDQDDELGVTPGPGAGSLTHSGIHRKFLNNITGSVANDLGSAETVRTPVEAIGAAGFILPQIMKVEKPYDGEATTSRTLGTTPPPGGTLSEQDLYSALIDNPSSAVVTQNAWVDPAAQTGLGSGDVRYNIYALSNTASSSNGNADLSIRITDRNVLVGDLNNDEVRDLQDTASLAQAYANPQAFAATQTGTAALDTGLVSIKSGGLVTLPGATATAQLINANLVVLTDFNSDGNLALQAGSVTLNGTEGSAGRVVQRSDIRYFLWGASVDTSAFNSATTMFLNGTNVNLTAAQNRMENGVRMGSLKKVQAITTFNSTLNGLVGTTVNPATGLNYTQGEVDEMKFSKFDVNGSDDILADSANGHRGLTIADAKLVNDAVGLDYTNFDHVMSTNIDLVATSMSDSDSITTHIDPDGAGAGESDFQEIRAALGIHLLDGDTDFDRDVDSVDFTELAANYGSTGLKWSDADFTFDGKVTTLDFNGLAGNFGSTAPLPGSVPGATLGATVPEPMTASILALGAMGIISRRRR